MSLWEELAPAPAPTKPSFEPTCDSANEIFPCSTNVWGNIFLMLMYGYILARASQYIADGSELLLDILDPGLIGGFLLPLLAALPDGAIVVASSLGNDDRVVEEIKVGMGTLAGSTIMLLTLAWGGSVIMGRCDLKATPSLNICDTGFEAIDKKLSSNWDFISTGVTVETSIKTTARIMLATSATYLLVLIIALITIGKPVLVQIDLQEEFTMAGFIICFTFFVCYSIWSVCNTESQQIQIEAAKEKVLIGNVERVIQKEIAKVEAELHDPHGKYSTIPDTDLETSSLTTESRIAINAPGGNALGIEDDSVSGIGTGAISRGIIDDISDDEGSGKIDEKQMAVDEAKKVVHLIEQDIDQMAAYVHGKREISEDSESESDSRSASEVLTRKQILIRAPLMLICATAVLTIVSEPMVTAMTNFSLGINVTPFYTAFVVAPFASNASEFLAGLIFASKKRRKNMTLSLGALYGAAIMNATGVLGIFLCLIYLKKLVFVFYAEVISVLVVVLIMGILGSFWTSFRSFVGIAVLLVYPFSIFLVWLLQTYVFHDRDVELK